MPVLVDNISPIGDQAAAADGDAVEVDRRQLVPGGKRDNQVAMNVCQRAPGHDQTTVRGARKGRDGRLDLAGVAHINRA